MTYIRCRIDIIDSPDDEHRGARNMQRIGINIYQKGTVCQVGYLQELKQNCHLRFEFFLTLRLPPCALRYYIFLPKSVYGLVRSH